MAGILPAGRQVGAGGGSEAGPNFFASRIVDAQGDGAFKDSSVAGDNENSRDFLAGAGRGDDDIGQGEAGEAGEILGLIFKGQAGGDCHAKDYQ